MISYATVEAFKSRGMMSISQSVSDAEILQMLESASRQVDAYCGRHFFPWIGERLFDGCYGHVLHLGKHDFVAGTLYTDDNLDRTFETTWAATDWFAGPYDADPGTIPALGTVWTPRSRPYKQIYIDLNAGTKSFFPRGRKSIKIDGTWGYWWHRVIASETMDEIADTTTQSVTVAGKQDVQVGHLIQVGTEYLYVKEGSGASGFRVDRGVLGTDAATASTGAIIRIFVFPESVVLATIEEAGRMYKRAQGGFGVAALEGGGAFPGQSQDFRQHLNQYRQWSFA